MSNLETPRINRWPFILGDVILLAVAGGLVAFGHRPLQPAETLGVAGLCAGGAWLMILPFLREHAAAVRLLEQAGLAGAAEQLGELHVVAGQIREATAQWQTIHDGAARAAATAIGAVEKVSAETRTLTDSLGRTNDQEKQALRLEIDKLRRGGNEHLQVIVHLLDHVHALYQAAVRGGPGPLVGQLAQFRAACLDASRRVGLASYEAQPGDAFDPKAHQTPDNREPAPGTVVAGTIACGYTYQGQPLRRILVAVQKPDEPSRREFPSDSPTSELPFDERQPS